MNYVDPLEHFDPVTGMYRLTGDNMRELHLFAQRMDLRMHWFLRKQSHYIIPKALQQRAVKYGAMVTSPEEMEELLRRWTLTGASIIHPVR